MDQLDNFLRWGATGAFGCGGLLYGISTLNNKEARMLERLPVVQTLSDLRSLEGTRGALPSGVSVAARGRVGADYLIDDTLSKRRSVKAWVTENEIIRKKERNRWTVDTRMVKLDRRGGSLYLKLLGDHRLHLKPTNDNDLQPIMETGISRTRPSDSNLFRQAVEATIGYVVTGYIEQEFLLPVDTEVTAIGQLSYNDANGTGFAIEPLGGKIALSRKTIQEQIKQLERWTKGLRWAAVSCGVFGAALLGAFCVRQGLKALQRKRSRLQEDAFLREATARREAAGRAPPPATDSAGPQASASEQGDQQQWHCIVCWESDAAQTVFPACGHVAVCQNCSPHIMRCPICRMESRPRLLYFS